SATTTRRSRVFSARTPRWAATRLGRPGPGRKRRGDVEERRGARAHPLVAARALPEVPFDVLAGVRRAAPVPGGVRRRADRGRLARMPDTGAVRRFRAGHAP